MQKNIVLFSLIVTIIIVLNCNLVYSEPIKDNIDENIKKENIGPYPTLDDLKKELKEERHNVDQQRLDEIRKKEEEKKAILIASEKARRLDTLIDEFSEMLRYDDRVEHLENSEIDVSVLLKQQLTGFYPLLEQNHMTLQENIEDDLMVYGDYDKLQRVFDNLLRNALNYSTPSSIISICGKKQEEKICITLSNQSEDLNQESVLHLFDKFYRAGSARTSSSGGAGLGLAIAKEIITLHKGTIEASIKDDRITFVICLPNKEEEKL